MNRLDDKETITISIQALKVTKRSMLYLQKSLIRRLQTGDIPVMLSVMLKNVTWNECHSRGIERLDFRASGLLIFRGDIVMCNPLLYMYAKYGSEFIEDSWNPIVLAIITISPWANGVPVQPWPSVSGTILFRGPSGIILAMWPQKKTGTTNFDHFSKWPPQNLRFPISRNQINTLYSMADHYYVCKRMKNMKKSKMAANSALYFGKFAITFVLVAIRRWFWCLNLSFHVRGFQ